MIATDSMPPSRENSIQMAQRNSEMLTVEHHSQLSQDQVYQAEDSVSQETERVNFRGKSQ